MRRSSAARSRRRRRGRRSTANREELLAAIRSAIDAHRIDMHLQPIVTLPQRKVRYYEALTRLRTEDGHMLEPPEFLEPAETGGLLGRLDHLLLFRCVQVLRRLLLKNREIGLFCNISATTLNDAQYFPQMVQFLEANRVLAPSLLLEFRQSALARHGAARTGKPRLAARARLPLLHGSGDRPAHRAARSGRARRALHQGSGRRCCSARSRRPTSTPPTSPTCCIATASA